MKATPFSLGAQRRHVRSLAVAAVEQKRAAGQSRRQAAAALHARVATPRAVLMSLMAGLVVGMLVPQNRRRARSAGATTGGDATNDRESRRSITHNAAVQQLLRAGRAYLAGWITRSLTP